MAGVALAGRNRRISRPESSIRTIGATLALRAVLRPQINLNDEGAATADAQFNKSTTGYGVGPTVVFNAIKDKLILMASGNVGTGLGRYLDATSNGFGAMSNFGLPGVTGANASINAVSVYGGMIGAQYLFHENVAHQHVDRWCAPDDAELRRAVRWLRRVGGRLRNVLQRQHVGVGRIDQP